MRQPLLGELAEFKENIEDNFMLENEVHDIIDYEAELSFGFEEVDKDALNVIENIIEKHTHIVELDGEELFKAVKISSELYKDIWEGINEMLEDGYLPDFSNKREVTQMIMKHVSGFVDNNYGMSQRDGFRQMEAFI